MAGQNNHQNDSTTDALVWMVLLGVLIIGAGWLYTRYQAQINTALTDFNLCELKLFALVSPKAKHVHEQLSEMDPGQMTWNQITAQFVFVGTYLRWVVAAVGVLCIFFLWSYDKVSNMTRRFTIERLIKENARSWPHIAPIANRQRSLLKESLIEGPWRAARSPLLFCLDHQLIRYEKDGAPVEPEMIIDVKKGLPKMKPKILKLKPQDFAKIHFDRKAAREVFQNQLGPLMPEKLTDMPLHYKGLAAAFIAFGHEDQKGAMDILNQMSLAFREPQTRVQWIWDASFPYLHQVKSSTPYVLDASGADEILERYEKSEILEEETSNHRSYLNVYMVSLLEFARRMGVMACPLFIWLRPLDRTLWSTLNQCGQRTAWQEAAGASAHYLAEKAVKEPLLEPEVEEAIRALEASLEEKGWIPPQGNF